MAPLRYTAKFDPFLSLDYAGVEGGGKFCHLATLLFPPLHLKLHVTAIKSARLQPLSLPSLAQTEGRRGKSRRMA